MKLVLQCGNSAFQLVLYVKEESQQRGTESVWLVSWEGESFKRGLGGKA